MAIDMGYDEGGSGDTLLVSCQISITEQAKKLKRKWKSRLENLKYFHSKDFDNYSQGVFSKAGLGREQRQELLKDLSDLIHCHVIAGVTARVSISEYDRITTQEFRSKAGTAYGFLIDMCLLRAHALLEELRLPTELNILVEGGHRNSEQVAQILTQLQQLPSHILPMPIKILTAGLGGKKDHPILQTADMLAYSQWQAISKGDPTIWRALHRQGMRYRSLRVSCTEQLIRVFMEGDDGVQQVNQYWERKKREDRRAKSKRDDSSTG
jgi:hypothetical protein